VEVLDAIIRDAESIAVEPSPPAAIQGSEDYQRALAEAAVSLARRSGAHAIVAVTREGKTVHLLSTSRPGVPIVAATLDAEVARRLSLLHGVVPVVCDLDDDLGQVVGHMVELAVQRTAAPANAIIVVINTSHELDRGSSNFVRIRRA
jgi:pyruvate kinase